MSFFESIGNFFSLIWNFISGIVESIILAFGVIQSSVSFSVFVSGLVFPFLGACIIAVVAIAVIKLIVGWGNA